MGVDDVWLRFLDNIIISDPSISELLFEYGLLLRRRFVI
jgi:hypothetical protein